MIGSRTLSAGSAAALAALAPLAAHAQDGRGLANCPNILTDQASCHAAAVSLPASMSSAAPGRPRTIENITPAATNPTRICWLGHYTGRGNAGAADETFIIRIFPDTGIGLPDLQAGAVFERTFRQSGVPGVDLLEMSCLNGQFCPGTTSPESGGLWVYSAEAPDGFTMTANGCYWVEIACAGSPQHGVDWFWSASSGGNDLAAYRATDGQYTHFSGIDYDRAVCVSGGVNPFLGNCIVHPGKPACFYFGALGQPYDGVTAAAEVSSSPDSPPAPGFSPTLWAENFELPENGTVAGVCFDGLWACTGPCEPPADPVFDLTYYADDAGVPGQPIATFRTGSPGVTLEGNGGEWTAIEHPPVPIAGGTCSWFSIGRLQGAADPGRLWSWRRTTAPEVGDGLVAAFENGAWTRRILAAGGSAATSHFNFGLNVPPFPQRPACTDCNANGTPDAFEIAQNPALDCFDPAVFYNNGNDAVLDRCQCRGDWDHSGAVNSTDISAYLTAWLCGVQCGAWIADFDCTGATNSSDISAFLAAWIDQVTGNDPLAGCP